ncbi:hypothetical protein [Sporosarcina sp. NPDC096371]|uniref:hypothetical protein n=1 Tax=Sporosarcina sp. NPDC096371 TaxID=3364530 RepID=UPI00380E9BE1
MAYTPTEWKNREVERPRTFREQNNPDGSITLIPAEGDVIEAGTPIIADNMNKIELGIKEAHDGLAGIGNVSQELETHMADYEYQTPTVVGTQIRITRQSETNRLFFKLDANLTGAITISLDGGTTSKNLIDVNGEQITSLDKGFVEVVAYANFFILRNKGGLSKADLEALIVLTNGAERNEDVIRTNVSNALNDRGGTTSPTDPWVVLVDAIRNGKANIEVLFKPNVTNAGFTPLSSNSPGASVNILPAQIYVGQSSYGSSTVTTGVSSNNTFDVTSKSFALFKLLPDLRFDRSISTDFYFFRVGNTEVKTNRDTSGAWCFIDITQLSGLQSVSFGVHRVSDGGSQGRYVSYSVSDIVLI